MEEDTSDAPSHSRKEVAVTVFLKVFGGASLGIIAARTVDGWNRRKQFKQV